MTGARLEHRAAYLVAVLGLALLAAAAGFVGLAAADTPDQGADRASSAKTVTADLTSLDAEATVDTNADIDDDGRVDEVRVQQAANQSITGTATVASGTELSVRVIGVDSESPFDKRLSAVVQSDGTWSATADFSGNDQGANFTVDVRRNGSSLLTETVDGRINPHPTASVTFNDQESFGRTVTVDSVTTSDGGFIVIHLDDRFDEIIGNSSYLADGSYSDVELTLNRTLDEDTRLVAMPHQDTDGDGTYEFEFGSELDKPYTNQSTGDSVYDGAEITVQDPITYSDLAVSETTVSDGDAVDISAKATNDDDSESHDYTAELKQNGTVVDTKSGTLAAGANTQVTFTTSFSGPGSYDVTIADLPAKTVTVEPAISYSDLTLSETNVFDGDTVDVSANVTNSAGSAREYTAELKQNGTVIDTKSGTLASGTNTVVTFARTFATVGSYEMTVGNLSTKTVTVTDGPPPASVEAAVEAAGTVELVTDETAAIRPDSVRVFLDGAEIYNAFDGTFAGPIDGVTVTPTTGTAARNHTITLTSGGEPVDIDPSRDLTVAFDLERTVDGETTLTDVSELVTVTGAVVAESGGADSASSAQRIYRGSPIAIRSDLSGNNTGVFINTTGQSLLTGQNSQILTLDSTNPQFNTGEITEVEFNGSSDNVEYFVLQELNWSVAAAQTTISNDSTLDVEVTANRGGAPFTAVLENGSGEVVTPRQQDLGGSGSSTLTFDPETVVGLNSEDGPYTVTAIDNQTNNTATTDEITVSDVPPANLSVDIESTNSPVPEGETLDVTATVTNSGNITTTETITLANFDGTQVDSRSVTLDEGNATTVTLSWNTNPGDAGSGAVTVAGANDSDTAAVTVQATAAGSPGVESAVEAAGSIEFVTNETTTIEPNSVQVFLDGTEIYNASDGAFAGPIDGATITPTTGTAARNHTITLTSGGSPVDIDPTRNLTVAFDLGFEESAADTARIFGRVTVTGAVVGESGGNDAASSAKRIYRGAPIAVRSDLSGSDTSLFIDATGQEISTGQNSQILTLDSTNSQFNTGETVEVEFNGSSSNVEYFVLRDLNWSVAAAQTTVSTESTLDIEVSAVRGGAPFTAVLKNGAGDVVATRQQDLGGFGSSPLTFDPQNVSGLNAQDGPYTVTATDNETTSTASTNEITVFEKTPPNFAVEVVSTNSPVLPGETLEVTANVTNVGGTAGSQELRLADFGGAEVDTKTVSLNRTESTLVTLEWATADSEAGSGEVTVASENDTATAAVAVNPTTATLSDVQIAGQGTDATIAEGTAGAVTARVQNRGDGRASFGVTLEIGDAVAETRLTAVLDPGEAETVRFGSVTGDLNPGEYTVEVATANATVRGALTVDGPPDDDPDPEPDPDPDPEPDPEPEPDPGPEEGVIPLGEISDVVDVPAGVAPLRGERARLDYDPAANRSTATFTDESAVATVQLAGEVEGFVVAVEYAGRPTEAGSPPGTTLGITQIVVPEGAETANATIERRVTVENSDADPADLQLNRYADGWQGLETELVEETGTQVRIRGETPGTSLFAVSAVSDPTPVIDVVPSAPVAGDDVTLDAEDAEDQYGEIVAYEWRVGGETLTGEEISVATETAGTLDVTLTVENDAGERATTTRAITVLEPPAFEVTEVDAPAEVDAGETVAVTATIANTGDVKGAATVSHEFAGADSGLAVTLDGGEAETVSFTVTAPAEAGDYQQTVGVGDDSATATTTVAGADEPTDDSTDPDGDGDSGDGSDDGSGDDSGPGFGVAAVVAAVLLVGTALRRRG